MTLAESVLYRFIIIIGIITIVIIVMAQKPQISHLEV